MLRHDFYVLRLCTRALRCEVLGQAIECSVNGVHGLHDGHVMNRCKQVFFCSGFLYPLVVSSVYLTRLFVLSGGEGLKIECRRATRP